MTQLAARLNCDKRTLQRRFERDLSCRFSDLVDDVRAEMFIPLLESGIFPMQAIAEQLGYATSGNFSRFFSAPFWLHAAGLDPFGVDGLIQFKPPPEV